MNLVVKMKFGSHVYGTNVPTSDTDIKQIYLPEPRDIVLQKVKDTINVQTKMDVHAKNTAEDIDSETFSYQQYLKLLMEGQTVALDMLFTPYNFHLKAPDSAWLDITQNREKFLHKGTSSFVGYCKTQAAKYGIKGSRMAALKIAINFLGTLNPDERLENHWGAIISLISTTEYMSLDNIKGPQGVFADYWNVCNCKMGPTAKVGYTLSQFQKIYDSYGHRAKLAEQNLGVDYKALMHAVRVCEEAKELLLTGFITFPRPEAPLLLKIRKGEMEYKAIAERIEQGLIEVEEAKSKSLLRETPDREFADNLVCDIYRRVIS